MLTASGTPLRRMFLRKSLVYLVLGVAAAGVGVVAMCFCILATLPNASRQPADPVDTAYQGETQHPPKERHKGCALHIDEHHDTATHGEGEQCPLEKALPHLVIDGF